MACCVQAVKAQRDTLQAEVLQLQQKLTNIQHDTKEAMSAQSKVLGLKSRTWLRHSLQLAVLLGYFCWEEYRWKTQCFRDTVV